jgi:hypothetical protein
LILGKERSSFTHTRQNQLNILSQLRCGLYPPT